MWNDFHSCTRSLYAKTEHTLSKPHHENLYEFMAIGICYLICEDCLSTIKHELFSVLVYWETTSPTGFNSEERERTRFACFGHHVYS